ncbi:hypothetical protein SFOMI_1805 [Sphingobium fuliginis]|uniref:Uncharacterized protein n=1 Tax=Sphingobium fuliginis (strain ATCC 27551) TaxID=336203 RepID=A0A292ZDS0_SPHSA|nr:hypothetical protein SFOMI_1805 [Sphingobium fuliginis]
MRPAEGEADLLAPLGERGVAAIAIDLQDACEVPEMGLGPFGLTVRGVDVGHHRRITAAPGSIVADIGPQLPGLGATSPGIEHRGSGLVGEEPLGLAQLLERVIAQGPQVPGRPADPVSERRAIELDTLAGVDLRLPVQGKMIGILGDENLGDQRLGRNAALDDPRRCWRLQDRALARTAAVARTPGDKDAEGRGNDVAPLGDILADRVERAAAAGAGLVLDIDDLLDALEMCGQRAAVGVARSSGVLLAGRGITRRASLAQRRLYVLEAELELIGIELLGTPAEAMAHEGIDDRLQPLDLGIGLALGEGDLGELAGLFGGERAERFDVLGKVRLCQHGRSESAIAHPVNRRSAALVDVGRHARGASPDPRARRLAVPRSGASRRPGSRASGSLPARASWPSDTARYRPTTRA